MSFVGRRAIAIQATQGRARSETGGHTLLDDGDVLLRGDHLGKGQYGSGDCGRNGTHFVGVAGSRRAFESCRVEPKQISKTSHWRSGRPTLVCFGRPKRIPAG